MCVRRKRSALEGNRLRKEDRSKQCPTARGFHGQRSPCPGEAPAEESPPPPPARPAFPLSQPGTVPGWLRSAQTFFVNDRQTWHGRRRARVLQCQWLLSQRKDPGNACLRFSERLR